MVIARKPSGIAPMWVLPVRHRSLSPPDSCLIMDTTAGSQAGCLSQWGDEVCPGQGCNGAYRKAERGGVHDGRDGAAAGAAGACARRFPGTGGSALAGSWPAHVRRPARRFGSVMGDQLARAGEQQLVGLVVGDQRAGRRNSRSYSPAPSSVTGVRYWPAVILYCDPVSGHLEGHLRPAARRPFGWDVLTAAITLVAGIVLPLACPLVRRGIASSPQLRAVPAHCSAPGPAIEQYKPTPNRQVFQTGRHAVSIGVCAELISLDLGKSRVSRCDNRPSNGHVGDGRHHRAAFGRRDAPRGRAVVRSHPGKASAPLGAARNHPPSMADRTASPW
jgi:hypothetical protein